MHCRTARLGPESQRGLRPQPSATVRLGAAITAQAGERESIPAGVTWTPASAGGDCRFGHGKGLRRADALYGFPLARE